MLIEHEPAKESARQRAMRVWRNAHVLKVMGLRVDDEPCIEEAQHGSVIPIRSIRDEIKNILSQKTNIKLENKDGEH